MPVGHVAAQSAHVLHCDGEGPGGQQAESCPLDASRRRAVLRLTERPQRKQRCTQGSWAHPRCTQGWRESNGGSDPEPIGVPILPLRDFPAHSSQDPSGLLIAMDASKGTPQPGSETFRS